MRPSFAIVLLVGGIAAGGTQEVVKRRPVEKATPELRVRQELAYPRTRVDPKTGETVAYDPKPEIVAIDERSGRYGLRWTGYDGQRKEVIYQLPDRMDAEVIASVRIDGSAFRYSYRVRVLPSSAQRLTAFWVQAFASHVYLVESDDLLFSGSNASNLTPHVPGSRWSSFSPQSPGPGPGQEGMFGIVSTSPPGLVECRISGASGAIQGVGEELPPELEGALLGYSAWPRGHTIGPSDELKSMAPAAKVDRLRTWLPEFERLGWMTAAARQRYDRIVRQDGIAGLLPLLEPDVAAGQVTSEVVAIVQGLAARF